MAPSRGYATYASGKWYSFTGWYIHEFELSNLIDYNRVSTPFNFFTFILIFSNNKKPVVNEDYGECLLVSFIKYSHTPPQICNIELGEMFDLEELSKVCATKGQYTFFFTSWPLNMYVTMLLRKNYRC